MVLPEPVRDWPMTSRPAIKGGMARVWISVGVSMFMRASAATVRGPAPSCANGWDVSALVAAGAGVAAGADAPFLGAGCCVWGAVCGCGAACAGV
jgi:hypothetical protein